MTKSANQLSDDELVAHLEGLVKERQRMTAQLADVHAGKAVDPFTLDLLRDDLDDDEVDELEALNEKRLRR